jgi:hypothetical protein
MLLAAYSHMVWDILSKLDREVATRRDAGLCVHGSILEVPSLVLPFDRRIQFPTLLQLCPPSGHEWQSSIGTA